MRCGPIITLCLALALSSCAPPPAPHWGGTTPTDQPYPFSPSSIRIFPLTRLDKDGSGRPMIVCHIEFRDAWGDSVKSVGRMQITMSGSGSVAGGPKQDLTPLTWDIDLDDLDKNARLYDRATRTYRVQLVDLPPILATGAPSDWKIALRVTLTAVAGGAVLLQDDYTLQN
jgi:hypothetical protein